MAGISPNIALAAGEPGLVSPKWRLHSTLSSVSSVTEGTPSWSSSATSVQEEPSRQGWAVTLASTPHGPPLIVAVNKDRQQLFMLEQRSPLSLKRQVSCSTGERVGDKVSQGDLKTPEGVYFVQQHLRGGLDFDLYGTMAFTLNYPNPPDRLKGKTGSGIWIHGRGHPLQPRETKGCVAVSNPDLEGMAPLLQRGTPVVIAHDLGWTDRMLNEGPPLDLAEATREWAAAWSARDEKFFEFFDAEKFSKAQKESFRSFKEQKQRLFSQLAWIHTNVKDIRVVPGPDYWVTYFNQYYRAPNMSTEGVRRLYWQQDASGQPRIIGLEWEEMPVGMERTYLSEASLSAAEFLDAWRASWEKADVDAYLTCYDARAEQADKRGLRAIRDHKLKLWKDKPPKRVAIDDLELSLDPAGLRVSFVQAYRAGGNFQDKGLKTLLLQPHGDSWRIVREEWSPM